MSSPAAVKTPQEAVPATIVLMAKPPVPGKVKTRLIGNLNAQQAAQIHGAMLECTLERLRAIYGDPGHRRLVLCLASDVEPDGDRWASQRPESARPWRIFDQGPGDLGQRMARVWRAFGDGPVVFLGCDSPDVPREALEAILTMLNCFDLVLGPAPDGGFWSLAARNLATGILEGIDWGSAKVYHQTCRAAERNGLTVGNVQDWPDVDTTADLKALLERLEVSNLRTEPDLERLRLQVQRAADAPLP
jgi:rSAM/selenodomain-associated transferase 1